MITMPVLRTSLLDLLHEIEGTDIKLIVGGGFGIYLKIDHLQQQVLRTLLQKWPEPRSTNDIDLFLRPELLIDSAKLKPLAKAIDRLGYQVVTSRRQSWRTRVDLRWRMKSISTKEYMYWGGGSCMAGVW